LLAGIDERDRQFVVGATADIDATSFLSGSLAVGLGHGRSDVDVHVISESADVVSDLPPRAPSGRRIQYEWIDSHRLNALGSIASGVAITIADRAALYMSEKELWDVFRTAVADPLHVLAEHSDLFTETFRSSTRRVIIGSNVHRIGRAADDVAGLLDVGAELAALDTAASAVRCAGEIFLAACGDYYASPKFLVPRLERLTATSNVATALLEAVRSSQSPRQMLSLAQTVSAQAQVLGWTHEIQAEDFRLAESGMYVRSLDWWLMRTDDQWSIASGSVRGHRTSFEMCALWTAADAGGRAAIASEFERLNPSTTPDLTAGLARLLEMGLIESRERR